MGEVALRFIQGGYEGSKGTATAATTQLLGKITSTSFNSPREFVDEDRSSLVGAYRVTQGIKDHGFVFEGEATYEQLGWHFGTGVKGSVSATTVGTTGKQYVFTPNATSAGDDLKAATVEFGDDSQEFELTYCEIASWTLGFDALTVGGTFPLMFSANYVGQAVTSNTKTASLSVPTVESIDGATGSVSIGATSVAFGSLTALTGSLRSFRLNYDNALGRKVFVGGGRTYSDIGRGRRMISFDAVFEGNSDGVTRFVEWDLATEKRLRLAFAGSLISGSSPATANQLRIDGRVLFTSFDPVGSVDTNTIYAISGQYIYDSTLASDIQMTLINNQASYT